MLFQQTTSIFDLSKLVYQSDQTIDSTQFPHFHQNYSFLVDMWSIGCVFVELITGQVLFRAH